MAKKKHHIHFLDVYNSTLHVAVTNKQFKHMQKAAPDMINPTDHAIAGMTMGETRTTGKQQSFHVYFWIDQKMWKKNGKHHSRLAAICAHEAAHGAGMIWRHAGANMNHVTLADDEPMAYLIQWLTELMVRKTLE